MSRFNSLMYRLRKLEPKSEYVEPWPPIEGSFEWAMLESMKAEGIEIPDKPPGESCFMFLARLEAPRLWANVT